MEEKLRQGPSSQVTSNTLKEERTVTSAPSGASPNCKQEKFVEVGRNVGTSLKTEVARRDSPPDARGYPAEEKLREIVSPEEPVAVRKEEGLPKAPNRGDPLKVDEKLRTPFSGAAAAEGPPKDIQTKAYNDKEMAKPPLGASSSAAPAEQKLQEMTKKLAPASMKEDAVPCSKGSASSKPVQHLDHSSMSACKEEKVGATVKQDPASFKASTSQKEEKLQEAAPVATEAPPQEEPPARASGGSPADAANKPNCCSCF